MKKILWWMLLAGLMAHVAYSACAGTSSLGYYYCRTLTVDHTKVPSTQTNFPVLVSVTNADFKTVGNGGKINGTVTCCSVGQTVAADLVFTSDSAGGSLLSWDFESYNATTGAINVWVKLASVSSVADTEFYVFYGKTGVATYQSTASSTWSNGFNFVQHMVSVSSLVDSTTNAVTGTNNGTTNTTGVINGSSTGNAQYQTYGTTTVLNPGTMTVSVWVNPTTLTNAYNAVVNRGNGTFFYSLFVRNDGKLALYCSLNGGGVSNYDGSGSHTLTTGNNYYLAFSGGPGNNLIGYVNGAVDGSTGMNDNFKQDASLTFGALIDSGFGGRIFNSKIDEIRVASVIRSANWLTTEYNNQSSPGTFITLGGQVVNTSGLIPRRLVVM